MNTEIGYNYDLEYRELVEVYVLGTIINHSDSSYVKMIIDSHVLAPNYFRNELHKSIMSAILECYNQKSYPNLVHVGKYRPSEYEFNNSNVFTNYLIFLSEKAYVSVRPLEDSVFILKQFVLMDFWNEKANDVLYGNWNGRDVLQVGDNIIKSYDQLFKKLTDNLSKAEETNDYANEMSKKVSLANQGLAVNVTTAVECIDEFVTGYNPGELFIVAGRPGMGKTTYALISAWETSKLGNPVAFFSLEMPPNQLKNKIISLETGIDYKDIKAGKLTSEQLQEVLKVNRMIDDSNFYIIGKSKYIEDISIKIAELIREHGIKLMILDYIQRSKTRENVKIREAVTIISRELKSIAVDNYIAVLALSQLSRAVEARINKRPLLSDLKESGSIEEDADVVAFLFRQAYYDEQNGFPVPYHEKFHTEFIIAKGRDLGTFTIHLFLEFIKMKIYEFDNLGNYDNMNIIQNDTSNNDEPF